jgi:hypothetical protein
MTWGRSEAEQQWVDDAERQEEERAAAKRELRRLDPTVVDQLRAELQREIAALRSEMAEQKELIFDAVGQALGEISNKICDRFEASINKLEGDVRRSFGEAMGRIDALGSGAPLRSTKDFRFANERANDVVDLPNPLRKMN